MAEREGIFEAFIGPLRERRKRLEAHEEMAMKNAQELEQIRAHWKLSNEGMAERERIQNTGLLAREQEQTAGLMARLKEGHKLTEDSQVRMTLKAAEIRAQGYGSDTSG